MGGWHLRMTWGQKVCYSSLHSETASTLGLLTVCSLCGTGDNYLLSDVNFACRIHPAAQSDIGKQQWVTGFHCVWSVVGWLIVPRWWLSLSLLIHSDHQLIGLYRLLMVYSWKAGPGEVMTLMTVENLFTVSWWAKFPVWAILGGRLCR